MSFFPVFSKRKSPCCAALVRPAQSRGFAGIFANGFSVLYLILFQPSNSTLCANFSLFATFHPDATITHGFFCPDFI
jgi:hypothetical protein